MEKASFGGFASAAGWATWTARGGDALGFVRSRTLRLAQPALPLFLFVAVLLAPTAAILAAECGPAETRLRAAMPGVAAAPFVPFAACWDALVRGARLSWNGPIFGRAVAFCTVLLLFVWTFDTAVTMPVASATKDSGHWFWVQHCAEMMFLPVVGLGRALWYFDVVARREGADLEPAA